MEDSQTFKRKKHSTSSASNCSNYDTPLSDEKPHNTASTSPLHDNFKSVVFNQKVQKDLERSQKEDTAMADQTTTEVFNFGIAKVSHLFSVNF